MANNERQPAPAGAVDAVTLEILGNRLLSVAEEMGATLIKTAYSTNIKERKDCSTAVFDATGNMIAQAEMIPMHLGSLLGTVEALLRKHPVGTLQEGDMFIANDPYSGGGTHLPDITLVAPAFLDGQLLGFVANIAHHADVGGKVPGSTSGDATSIFQEGVRIPLVQICRAGEVIQDAMEFVTLNSRIPLDREGDLAAQIAANRVGVRRLSEVAARYGITRYNAAVDALLDYAETMMRAGIATLPDGVYSFTDYMDDDGVNLGVPVPITATITIKGDSAIVDFAGSSRQVAGPVNVPLGGTLATVFYCFKALVGPTIPSNHGIYRALKVTAPEGTIVNCHAPAPVGARIDACQRVADVIFGAMFAAAPERVIAGSNSSVTTATFSGTHPGSNAFYVYLETIAGGSGAFHSGDGLSAVQVHMTNTSNLPIEALEREYPLLVQRYGLRQDSGGPGRQRGGLGIVREIRALHQGVTFSAIGDRQRIAPWGLVGGHDGAPGRFYLVKTNGEAQELGSRQSNVAMGAEEIIRVCTPGAGGYGSPLERDPALVLKDFREGKVSAQAVSEAYGVVLTADGAQVDPAATKQRRLSRSQEPRQ